MAAVARRFYRSGRRCKAGSGRPTNTLESGIHGDPIQGDRPREGLSLGTYPRLLQVPTPGNWSPLARPVNRVSAFALSYLIREDGDFAPCEGSSPWEDAFDHDHPVR